MSVIFGSNGFPYKTALHGCSGYLHCSHSVETVVRMRVGSGQTVELSADDLFIFHSQKQKL